MTQPSQDTIRKDIVGDERKQEKKKGRRKKHTRKEKKNKTEKERKKAGGNKEDRAIPKTTAAQVHTKEIAMKLSCAQSSVAAWKSESIKSCFACGG